MTTEERVKRLEREVRWTRVGGAVMAVALACVVLVGAGQDQEKAKTLKELRVSNIVLVDENEVVCGDLSATSGAARLALYDSKEGVSAILTVTRSDYVSPSGVVSKARTASLWMSGGDDHIALATGKGGGADKGGSAISAGRFGLDACRVSFGINEDGELRVLARDRAGKVLFETPK